MKNTLPAVKAFVDTNVLVDFLLPERPKHGVAREVFQLIYSHKIEAAISTQSLLDAAYICGKHPGFKDDAFRESVLYLMMHTNVDYLNSFNAQEAFLNPHSDMEDSAQINFAYNRCCDVIITSDRQMLEREVPRPMQVMTPEVFVDNCRA